MPPEDSLPINLETSLLLVERGYMLRHGGALEGAGLPELVLGLLKRIDEARIDWVLVGAGALNLYHGKPRATVDLDMVVRSSHFDSLREILGKACTEVTGEAERLRGTLSPSPMELTVDVLESGIHPLLEEALSRQVRMGLVRVPVLEALLALKFLSATGPWRDRAARFQDVADFMRAFDPNAKTLDRALLVQYASLAHENARQEFAAFLDAVETGKPITI